MIIVCVAGFKGGIGKTTTATTLSYLLAKEKGKRVLLVDADRQGNASMVYGEYTEEKSGMAVLMEAGLESMAKQPVSARDYIISTKYDVDIITANGHLTTTNGKLLVEKEKNQVDILCRALSDVGDDYDFCLIDCGLEPNMTVVNAIMASDIILTPMKLGGYEFTAVRDMENQIRELAAIKPDLRIKVLLSDFKKSITNQMIAEELKMHFGSKLMQNHVRDSTMVTKYSYMPGPLPFNSKNSIAVKDYRLILDELLQEVR